MADPIETHRKEVEQRIQIMNTAGGWEGTHTEFKRELDSKPRDLAKLFKHILAFANTPRRTDAYIIFGVEEDKEQGTFKHVGVPDHGFPSAERINALIHEYTSFKDVLIDRNFELDGKRTPYVSIPLQYDGPYTLSRLFEGASAILSPDTVYCRYGSSSLVAPERDARRMMADWGQWFLDYRYEKDATALMGVLAKRFPRYARLSDEGSHVHLEYDSEMSDEFGISIAPVLVHAYWGFDAVLPATVERIIADQNQRVFRRTIVAGRFSPDTQVAAKASGVRCVLLDEIYFVNDPYARLCRVFLKRWSDERSARQFGHIVDLDYRLSLPENGESHTSILSFLEENLQSAGRVAILVHGAFGCGKTTTAKQLVADLAEQYLRGRVDLPKLMYVDVNNIDIRSRRDECIQSQLAKFGLPREDVEKLIGLLRDDQMHLVFDGVDEMARPYSQQGRRDAVEILRDIGNRRTAVYFIRSSYYPQLHEMISDFSSLADHDFAEGQRRIIAAEIQELRETQVVAYLESRLGPEDARKVRSGLHKLGFASFLVDPLIVSLVTNLVEREGYGSIEAFPQKGGKVHLVMYLVNQLLEREQSKRQRHNVLGGDFALFQRVLRTVAFKMICTGITAFTQDRLQAFIQPSLSNVVVTIEALDAFRTVSWIQRSADGVLAFRHEALTLVCAAEHICVAIENGDMLALSEWQGSAPLAEIVCEYASEILNSAGLLGAMAMLGSDLQFNVRQLIIAVLQTSKSRENWENQHFDKLEVKKIASILRGITNAPHLASSSIRVLLRSLGEKRRTQLAMPMLLLLTRVNTPEAVETASEVLRLACIRARNFCEEISDVKKDQTNYVDSVLLKELGISIGDLVDGLCYENLFRKLCDSVKLERPMKQYAERTMSAIEGAKARREAALRAQHAPRKRRH